MLSPLLANLYRRRFIRGWERLGHAARLQAAIVNYADDFVICTRGRAEEARTALRAMMARLRLTVNERKTRRCQLPAETFTFLGYTFGRHYSRQTGGAYTGPRPAAVKVRQLCRALSETTDRRTCQRAVGEQVAKLNQQLQGWANYFCLGPVVRTYEVVLHHARRRLRRWLCQKHKVRHGAYARYPNEVLHGQLGLVQLGVRRHRWLWATT